MTAAELIALPHHYLPGAAGAAPVRGGGHGAGVVMLQAQADDAVPDPDRAPRQDDSRGTALQATIVGAR